MKRTKKFISTLIALSMLSSAVYADIPKGTVIIGDKAYDLSYANDHKNLKEITDQIVGNQSEIYIKWNDGKLYYNATGNETTEDFISEVTYKDAEGNLIDYAAEDGEEIILNVIEASYISSNQVKIRFNKKVLYESAVYKENYKIGSEHLEDGDIISLGSDGQTIIITLDDELEEGIIESNIVISEELLDLNNNKINNEYERNVFVVNNPEESIGKEINGDINIIADDYLLSNVKVNGSVYVNADNVNVNNVEMSENMVFDLEEDETSSISNVDVDKVLVSSRGESSIELSNVKGNKLEVNSSSKVEIVSKIGTEMGSTLIRSNTVLNSNSGSLGEITVNIEKSNEEREVELKGKYTEPIIVKRGVVIKASEDSVISELNIAAWHKDNHVVLDGNFENVEINRESKVTLLKDSVVKQLIANADVTLDGDKSSKIEKLFAEEEVTVKIDDSDENGGFAIPDVKPIEEQNKPSEPSIPSIPDYEYKPTAKDVNVTGTLKVGNILVGRYVYSDMDGDIEGDSIFKWYRADDANGTGKREIPNVSNKFYTLTSEDEGKYISFEVTPVAKTGAKTGTTVISNVVGPIETNVVIIEDTEKPVIQLLFGKEVEYLYGDEEFFDVVIASDNVDGDITDKIERTIFDENGNIIDSIDRLILGTYKIHYNVTDVAGNKADELIRTIIVREAIDHEKVVNVDVFGQKVRVDVESKYIKDGVTIEIVDSETSEVVFIDQLKPENNRAVFETEIENTGQYVAYVNAIEGYRLIEKSFEIKGVSDDSVVPEITLIGEETVVIYRPQNYVDAGATAVDDVDGDITGNIQTTITDQFGNTVESIDTLVLGTYTIHYNVTDEAGNMAEEVTRTVIVREAIVEDEVMDITVVKNIVTVTVESEYIKDAVTLKVVDSENNIIAFIDQLEPESNRVVFETEIENAGIYTVYVNAIEGYGVIQKSFEIQEAQEDIVAPEITLNGESRIVLYGPQNYVDSGATAVDDVDGDITGNVVTTIIDQSGNIVESINTLVLGTYTIHYNVTDEAGNMAEEVTRTVIVRETVVEDEVMDITVVKNIVTVTVENEYIKDAVTIKIVDSENNEVAFIDQLEPENNRVVFEVEIENAGQYTAYVNAIEGYGVIQKSFMIFEVSEDIVAPEITLNGESRIVLYGPQNYVDSGATAVDDVDGDITGNVVTTITDQSGNIVESINTLVLGTYTIHYNVTDEAGNMAEEVTRTVIVRESISEDLVTVKVYGQEVLIIAESQYVKEDVSIKIVDSETDEVVFIDQLKSDGNRVVFKPTIDVVGQYTVFLNVIDGYEVIEKTFEIEELVVDEEKPLIILNGESRVVLYGPEAYYDLGAVALDNIDGDISGNIEVTITDALGNVINSIDTSKLGTYTIHYNVTDEAGNMAEEVTRTVVVREPLAEDTITMEVNGKDAIITVESKYIKDDVSIKVFNSETGQVVYLDQIKSQDYKAIFNTQLEKSGKYTVAVNAIDGVDYIEREFEVTVTDEVAKIEINEDHTVKITLESVELYPKVTLRIVDAETEKVVFFGEKITMDNKVEFITKLLEDGIYKVYINAYGPGTELIEETITIGN